MIKSKSDLSEYIKSDNAWSISHNNKEIVVGSFLKYPSKSLRRFMY